MTYTLKNNGRIWRLAKDLGLSPKDNPLEDILCHCAKRVRSFMKEFPCGTLSELLEMAAAKLDTVFVEIHSDRDLDRVKVEYLNKGETAFALLDKELGPNVYAVTFKRLAAKLGDREYVSVIDCRGKKGWRTYFSKWHELAHLLTLTQQMRLKFCRTHADATVKDPEEALMEVIAGQIGFFADIIAQHVTGRISFQKIQDARSLLCPEASQQASIIGFVNAWPLPSILVEAGLGRKAREEEKLDQGSFDFIDVPEAKLRALRVSPNEHARQAGLVIHRNMRIPSRSVIHQVFDDDLVEAEAQENLGWWETSGGQCLPEQAVHVIAKKSGDHVLSLITPIE